MKTVRLVHNSSQGALEIAGVPGAPEPGVPFEVATDEAEALLIQTDLYAIAPEEKKK